jgi:hypothetical protein
MPTTAISAPIGALDGGVLLDHLVRGDVAQFAGADRLHHPLVAIQQPQRHPTGVGQPGKASRTRPDRWSTIRFN